MSETEEWKRICDAHTKPIATGQMFTDWKCMVCKKKDTYANTAVPKVCERCGKKHNLCLRCGSNINIINKAISLARKESFEKGQDQEFKLQEHFKKSKNQIDFDEFLVDAKNKYQDKKGMYKIGGFNAKITDSKERTEKFKGLIDTLSGRVKDNRGAVLLFFTFNIKKVDENFVTTEDVEIHFAHISIDVHNALIMCLDFLKNISKQQREETK